MKVSSLAFRLFTTAMAWTLIALPIVGIIIYNLISTLIMDAFDTRLRQHTWLLQAAVISDTAVAVRPTNLTEPLFEVPNSGWYWRVRPLKSAAGPAFVSRSLKEVGLDAAEDALPSPYERGADRSEGDIYWLDIKGSDGQPLRVVELVGTIGKEADSPTYLFAVAGPLDWPGATINRFGLILALAFSLMGLALLAATYFQVKWALRPLSVIEQGLSNIRTGEAERLDGQFPSEIEPLQVELNALIESNEDIIERARTQVGNLAHALKTPLAVIANEADQAKTPLAEKVTEQADIMGNQITHYLDRARMAARANTIGRMTPIRSVVDGLRRALERIHRDKGVRVIVSCPVNLAFRGERQDLEELLGNLLDNACKWAQDQVRLTGTAVPASPQRTGQWLEITIEDNGPGVPATERAQMMQRGRRFDESKPGSGLGLSIVYDLITSYRGEIEFSESELGGLKAKLLLPASTPAK